MVLDFRWRNVPLSAVIILNSKTIQSEQEYKYLGSVIKIERIWIAYTNAMFEKA